MSRYHASSSTCSSEASVLTHRQKYAPHLDAANKEWNIEIALADYLFAAEMYAADLLMARKNRIPDNRSHIQNTGRTRPLIKLGN